VSSDRLNLLPPGHSPPSSAGELGEATPSDSDGVSLLLNCPLPAAHLQHLALYLFRFDVSVQHASIYETHDPNCPSDIANSVAPSELPHAREEIDMRPLLT
jgi:hypothetical protein